MKGLIVVTSHDRIGDTGRPTGFYYEEMAVPYWLLRDAGLPVDIASIRGGRAPHDPGGLGPDAHPAVARFLSDGAAVAQVEATLRIDVVDPSAYDVVFLAGGHGTMWDFAQSAGLARVVEQAWAGGAVIGAVCHGVAGLLGARDSTGLPLVQGRRINSFTDAEEEAVGLSRVVPFLLESRLRELGGRFEGAGNFQPMAVRDGRLVTGQNPASAALVGELMIEALSECRAAQADLPPLVRRPEGARPVMVMLDMTAKNGDAFRDHLLKVIPVTRLASGAQFSWSTRDPDDARRFTLIQGWDSLPQQQAYIAWREGRGDLAEFLGFLEHPPRIEVREVFDG